MHMPTAEAVNETRKQRFAQQITETIESEDLSFFRQIIEDYENEHDTTAEDIAAALAVIAQQGRPFFLDESEDIAHSLAPSPTMIRIAAAARQSAHITTRAWSTTS